jgi:hypothetical protein
MENLFTIAQVDSFPREIRKQNPLMSGVAVLYMDGNGRMGRFLMNTMMASGGYPWTVIPVGERAAYMNALKKASIGEDIAPFAAFLAGLVKKGLAGEPLPEVPTASS